MQEPSIVEMAREIARGRASQYGTALENSAVGDSASNRTVDRAIRHVEQQVKGPSAHPRELAAIVSSLPSSTERANRTLTSLQLRRLESIAEKHGGKVGQVSEKCA